MGFVRLYCPTCGAGIELDNSREYGFCQYCGTKVVQDKIVVEHRGSVEIDRSSEIRNLLILANELTSQNRIEEAESYYNRVLEYDVNNPTAREGLRRIYRIVTQPNVSIIVTTGKLYNRNIQVKLEIDNQKKGKIPAGISQSFTLPVGEHTITVSIPMIVGSKKKLTLRINDRFDKFQFEFKCKIGNVIEIIQH